MSVLVSGKRGALCELQVASTINELLLPEMRFGRGAPRNLCTPFISLISYKIQIQLSKLQSKTIRTTSINYIRNPTPFAYRTCSVITNAEKGQDGSCHKPFAPAAPLPRCATTWGSGASCNYLPDLLPVHSLPEDLEPCADNFTTLHGLDQRFMCACNVAYMHAITFIPFPFLLSLCIPRCIFFSLLDSCLSGYRTFTHSWTATTQVRFQSKN